jgi:hypothetical protein
MASSEFDGDDCRLFGDVLAFDSRVGLTTRGTRIGMVEWSRGTLAGGTYDAFIGDKSLIMSSSWFLGLVIFRWNEKRLRTASGVPGVSGRTRPVLLGRASRDADDVTEFFCTISEYRAKNEGGDRVGDRVGDGGETLKPLV